MTVLDTIAAFTATYADEVTEVRRKNQQLRAVARTLPWPKLMRFEAGGRMYDLPLPASKVTPALAADATSASRLRFLAGFFDGDGTVACQAGLSGCMLVVSQSFDRAEILMLLRETFGGSINLQNNGLGLSKPTLQWVLWGRAARRGASLLVPHSITKKKQLLLAVQWPDTKSRRVDSKAELHNLNKYDSAVTGTCSWEYCAGFFDAEGCIVQQRHGASLVLDITQKHPQVLMCLRTFLADASGIGAVLSKTNVAHRLRVYGLQSCKRVLQQMLDAGLLCKEKQAELALSLTPENAAQVSTELVPLAGNQQFGKKLDLAGQGRANRINVLRKQASTMLKRGRLQTAEAMLRHLEVLRLKHEFLKALHENEELVRYASYIRHLHFFTYGSCSEHGAGMEPELGLKRIDDYASTITDYESLLRMLEKLRLQMEQDGGPPKAFIKAIGSLEDYVEKQHEEKKQKGIKLQESKNKAFNTLRAKVKKGNKPFADDLEQLRNNPDDFQSDE
ncbi:NIP1, partial [Symbiodinium microadriaticum]